jgi:hypothetical protein
MSEAVFDAFDRAAIQLRKAMESGESETIDAALQQFTPALEAIRAVGAWRTGDAFRSRVAALRQRLESDQMLSRMLADLTSQQLDLLAIAAPASRAARTYQRG